LPSGGSAEIVPIHSKKLFGSCAGTTFPASRCRPTEQEATMGFGRGVLLWLIGIPIPLIILLAIFMHH
jgi:hypothetical protein